MKGYMTFYLGNDPPVGPVEKLAMSSSILQAIHAGMDNNAYASGNVVEVVFVGSRTSDGRPVAAIEGNQPQKTSTGSNGGLPSSTAGAISGVIVFLFLLLVLAVIARRRRDEVANEPQLSTSMSHETEKPILEGRDIVADTGARIPETIDPFSMAEKDALAIVPQGLDHNDDVGSLSSGISSQTVINPLPPPESTVIIGPDTGAQLVLSRSAEVPPAMSDPETDGEIIRALNTIAEDGSETTDIHEH